MIKNQNIEGSCLLESADLSKLLWSMSETSFEKYREDTFPLRSVFDDFEADLVDGKDMLERDYWCDLDACITEVNSEYLLCSQTKYWSENHVIFIWERNMDSEEEPTSYFCISKANNNWLVRYVLSANSLLRIVLSENGFRDLTNHDDPSFKTADIYKVAALQKRITTFYQKIENSGSSPNVPTESEEKEGDPFEPWKWAGFTELVVFNSKSDPEEVGLSTCLYKMEG